MQILSEERLQDRARDLEGEGLNGLRLAYVTLEPVAAPTYAFLDVDFFNGIALASPTPPAEVFRIVGGQRRRGGNAASDVQVVSVQPGTGTTLRLKVAPLGDYSTYVLSTDLVIDPNTGLPAATARNNLPRAVDPLLNALPFKFRPGCFNINCAPAWDAPPEPPDEPSIDYLARDYDSFRHVLMSAMSRRVPDWAPTSEADLDQVLIDLIAADADEQADFHDRVMNERSISTARKRVTIARHARLMDYHVHQGNQAETWLALEVGGTADLPQDSTPLGLPSTILPNDEFIVWTGARWDDPSAVIFAMPRGEVRWRRRFYPILNRLRFYTWRDTVTALAAGSTEADIVGASPFTQMNAEELRDLLLGLHPDQSTGPATIDVTTTVDHLLIEEALNPETGTENGKNVGRRQVVQLLPLNGSIERAEAMQDPFTHDWFVRVRWLAADELKQNFCIATECNAARVGDVSLLHGNLVLVTHGQPCITTFHPEQSPVTPSANDRDRILRNTATYDVVDRQGEPERPRGAACVLPRAPLAYRNTEPGGDRPTRTTLEVRMGGFSVWEERADLIESEGDDEHFIVETDELGISRLRFGDGTNGAPVPDEAVVVCRFRVGQGVGGNVGADTLTGFDATGGVILDVWNPLDVLSGRDPEPAAEIVRRVPEKFRLRQRRAVTLDDYAKCAEQLDGVAHARARYAWTGSWRTVRVAIDPLDAIATDSGLFERVASNLEAVRLIGEDVEVRRAEYVPLDIHMRLCAHSQYWPEDLRSVLEMEFSDGWTPDGRRGFFHPDEWTFGQDVWASQLIGRALAVTGVERVLRLSMRRWNPGAGGGVTAIVIEPKSLPESLVETLPIGPFEIVVVANDPDHLETGRIIFEILGGRR